MEALAIVYFLQVTTWAPFEESKEEVLILQPKWILGIWIEMSSLKDLIGACCHLASPCTLSWMAYLRCWISFVLLFCASFFSLMSTLLTELLFLMGITKETVTCTS